MFALGIQQMALQCLTNRSMPWTGNSALPSVWRVYLHRFMLLWWYWGAVFAWGKLGGHWLFTRLTQTSSLLWKLMGFMGTALLLAAFTALAWNRRLSFTLAWGHWLDSALTLKSCWSNRRKGNNTMAILAAVPSGRSLHSLLPELLGVCRWMSQGSCYDWSVSCTVFVAKTCGILRRE